MEGSMSIKVLVADDSITIQKVIGIIFGGEEYSLTVVDNGKAAVDKALEITPDVLLIDVLMPGMTGYEVAEMVRSTPSLATKPILLLTGSFEPFDEEKAKKCGADDFIAKPFESQQIITKVKELVELGNARALTAQAPTSQPPVEKLFEPVPVAAAPIIEKPSPVVEPYETPQAAAPADIWGAFTPDIESPVETFTPPSMPSFQSIASTGPDVFAIVSEENDAELLQPVIAATTSPQHTGSQWIPVEENTFEFEEETIAEPPQAAFVNNAEPIQEASFGDIAFEDEPDVQPTPALTVAPESAFFAAEPEFSAPEQAFFPSEPEPTFVKTHTPAPVFEPPAAPFAPLADPTPVFAEQAEVSPMIEAPAVTAPVITAPVLAAPVLAAPAETLQAPVVVPQAAMPQTTPAAAASPAVAAPAAPAALTEEQLTAALSSASKEVIERIVWEIVPDLAEAMIREAIRKIKEGI
jgi:CheY-like chemotaxis protein